MSRIEPVWIDPGMLAFVKATQDRVGSDYGVPLVTVSQVREMVERVRQGYIWSNHNMFSENGSKETEWALSALDALLAELPEESR